MEVPQLTGFFYCYTNNSVLSRLGQFIAQNFEEQRFFFDCNILLYILIPLYGEIQYPDITLA